MNPKGRKNDQALKTKNSVRKSDKIVHFRTYLLLHYSAKVSNPCWHYFSMLMEKHSYGTAARKNTNHWWQRGLTFCSKNAVEETCQRSPYWKRPPTNSFFDQYAELRCDLARHEFPRRHHFWQGRILLVEPNQRDRSQCGRDFDYSLWRCRNGGASLKRRGYRLYFKALAKWKASSYPIGRTQTQGKLYQSGQVE